MTDDWQQPRGAPDDVALLLCQIHTALNKIYLFSSDVSNMTGVLLKTSVHCVVFHKD